MATGGSWKRQAWYVLGLNPRLLSLVARDRDTLRGRLAALRLEQPAEWDALIVDMGVVRSQPEPLRRRRHGRPPSPTTHNPICECGRKKSTEQPKCYGCYEDAKRQPPTSDAVLWTVFEFSVVCRVSRRTIYNRIRDGVYREGAHYLRLLDTRQVRFFPVRREGEL